MNTALLSALHEIENDKGIPFETVKGVLEESLLAAYEGREGANEDARVVLDEDTGDLRVMKDDEDITPHDFTRIAAQVMRQTFYQRLNEVHNEQLLEEYGERMGDIVTGIVQQAHRRMTLVDLGRVEAILPASEQVPQERYENGQRLKVYLLEIREGGRGPSLTVSRRHEGLLKNLFELEVPEIYDGLVEIKAVAREAGLRSKVAGWLTESGLDPVRACAGARGGPRGGGSAVGGGGWVEGVGDRSGGRLCGAPGEPRSRGSLRAPEREDRHYSVGPGPGTLHSEGALACARSRGLPGRRREAGGGYRTGRPALAGHRPGGPKRPACGEANRLEDRHKAREPGHGVRRGTGRGLGARGGLGDASLPGRTRQRAGGSEHGAGGLP